MMVNVFTYIDLIFLVLFVAFFSVFLYTRKHNIKREGLMVLYRAQWGIKLINYLGSRYKKTLKSLSYVSIAVGYLLLVGVLYLIYGIVKIYFFIPDVVRAIKVPPLLPLVPYLPQVFKLSFLPPFYFTYWIVILAVIAIPHELFHGIFMRRYNIKIKTTGFAFFPYFFPIFPAAFVEQDEKSFVKAKKFDQMAALSAGTFANVLTAILFFGILWIFFTAAFAPSGVIFDSYATSPIAVAGITSVNGILVTQGNYSQIVSLSSSENFSNLPYNNQTYLVTQDILQSQEGNSGEIYVYNNAPAIRDRLESTITDINDVQVRSLKDLSSELAKYPPGQTITITTKTEEGFITRNITLEEHPERPGTAWLGVGFLDSGRSGLMGKIIDKLSSFKKPNTYYEPKLGGLGVFIYNLLWWTILISISVAFINMLPMGIFDGGRFFYLTVLSITGKEKFAERMFKASTYFFLLILLLLMIFWGLSWF